MDSDIPKGIKRKCTSFDQIKSSKRKRPTVCINILNLSDCALLEVLKYLDATSLYQLGQTCSRFKGLVQDESLWVHVDARGAPNDWQKIDFCWKNVNKRTKWLLMAGNRRSQVALSIQTFIVSSELKNLTVLALEHQCIKYCKLKEFPSTLQELSFRHSYIPHHMEFFRFAQQSMGNLKTLILDHCQWLEACCLMSFCRFPVLEILSLYMCKKLGDDNISSVSLASKFGFRTLKVVDLRFTGLGDLFIKTFYKIPSLQVLYFQCFPTTYSIEKLKRKMDISNGETVRENAYMSEEEDNDMSKRSLCKRFGTNNLIPCEGQTISDTSMMVFDRLKPSVECKTRPTSYLYSYPYEECSCGFFDKASSTYGPLNPLCGELADNRRELSNGFKYRLSSSSDSSDDDDDDAHCDNRRLSRLLETTLKRKRRKDIYFLSPNATSICHKMVFDSCTLPEWCQVQSTPDKLKHRWMYLREPRNDHEIAMFEHTEKNFRIRTVPSCGKENWTCNCDDSCDDCKQSVIVIARQEDGSLYQFSPRVQEVSSNQANTKETYERDINKLITKISECLVQLSQNSDIEPAIFISEIMTIFDECLSIDEFIKLSDDADFVYSLHESFAKLVENIHQNIQIVLQYHTMCFQDLVKQLEKDDGAGRKCMLQVFLKNLLRSEGLVSNSDEDLEVSKPQTVPTNWNLPGPSGLQSTSSRSNYKSANGKKKRIKMRKSANEHLESISESGCIPISHERFDVKVQARDEDNPVVSPEFIALHVRTLRSTDRNSSQAYRHFIVQMQPQQNGHDIPTNIKELSLRGYGVTDETLRILKEMELDLLDVTNTEVTVEGLQEFMLSNPHCRLIHECACICRPKLHF